MLRKENSVEGYRRPNRQRCILKHARSFDKGWSRTPNGRCIDDVRQEGVAREHMSQRTGGLPP